MAEIPIQGQLQSVLRPLGPTQSGAANRDLQPQKTEDGKTFADLMTDSINEVNRLQNEASQSLEKLATGESRDVHNTVIQLQKASVSFKMMMEVRNKLVDAYKEVMRTQL
ncbi:flagellar hook-basal body complex protein FliE [Candidatus Sumerlaeota bacterium]|nr:flagellar hook-basal body complex protein FliE [Candidatus Sumerlaeota bacterium]